MHKGHITLSDRTFRPLISHDDVQAAVSTLAQKINADYGGGPAPLFVGVLNGAFMFAAELLRRVEFDCEVCFVKLASYNGGTSSSGSVEELIALNCDAAGRRVIVVEDIVETGNSIEHIISALSAHNPESIEVATLLFKPAAYKHRHAIKYPAIEIGNDFVVGFGMDYKGLGRNLSGIYTVVDE